MNRIRILSGFLFLIVAVLLFLIFLQYLYACIATSDVNANGEPSIGAALSFIMDFPYFVISFFLLNRKIKIDYNTFMRSIPVVVIFSPVLIAGLIEAYYYVHDFYPYYLSEYFGVNLK